MFLELFEMFEFEVNIWFNKFISNEIQTFLVFRNSAGCSKVRYALMNPSLIIILLFSHTRRASVVNGQQCDFVKSLMVRL